MLAKHRVLVAKVNDLRKQGHCPGRAQICQISHRTHTSYFDKASTTSFASELVTPFDSNLQSKKETHTQTAVKNNPVDHVNVSPRDTVLKQVLPCNQSSFPNKIWKQHRVSRDAQLESEIIPVLKCTHFGKHSVVFLTIRPSRTPRLGDSFPAP